MEGWLNKSAERDTKNIQKNGCMKVPIVTSVSHQEFKKI